MTTRVIGRVFVAAVTLHGGGLAQPPEVRLENILHAATLSGPPAIGRNYSRGTILSIFGGNLAPGVQVAPNSFPLPVQLLGTQVLFSGIPGALLYVSPAQINVIVPDVPQNSTYSITVSTLTGSWTSTQFSPQAATPGVFAMDGSGCGRPALWNHRLNRLLQPADALQPGDVATFFGTGFGPPVVPDRMAAPSDPPLSTELPFGVFVGSESAPGLVGADVLWQGKAPGLAGVDQFNFRVPEDAQEGCAVPFRVIKPNYAFGLDRSQILHVPISRNGGSCKDPPRPGFLRLILVREINSGLPQQPARRDRLWVDFFRTPPPGPAAFNTPLGTCGLSRGGRFLGRVCPGLEGASEDDLADTTAFDTDHWADKVPQDAGMITVTTGSSAIQLGPGLPNGLPFYPADLRPGMLEPGDFVVKGSGGEHIGPFEARIQLPRFEILSDLSPGTLFGSVRLGLQALRWSGGTGKGIVRWWYVRSECKSASTDRGLGPFPPPWFMGQVAGEMSPATILFSPGEEEEVTFTAGGLRYGGRLSYLYVYRYGGLRLSP